MATTLNTSAMFYLATDDDSSNDRPFGHGESVTVIERDDHRRRSLVETTSGHRQWIVDVDLTVPTWHDLESDYAAQCMADDMVH